MFVALPEITRRSFKYLLLLVISVYILSFGCRGNKSEPSKSDISLRNLYEMTIASARTQQDFHRVIDLYENNKDIKDGERTSLVGLAYIYQAEVYEILAELLSMVQLDLLFQSRDPEHGHKFPVDMRGLSNKESTLLRRLLLFDVWRILGSDAALVYLDDDLTDYSTQDKAALSRILKRGDKLWTDWISDRNVFAAIGRDDEAWEIFTKGITHLKEGYYCNAIEIVGNAKAVKKDLFEGNQYVSYYDPLTYYLLADAYQQRGIQVLNTALALEYITPDSSKFQMMNVITFLGAIAGCDQETKYASSLSQLLSSDYFLQHRDLFRELVCEYPFRLTADWFSSISVAPDKRDDPLQKSWAMHDCQILQGDHLAEIMTTFLADVDQVPSEDVENLLVDLNNTPETMDRYPILLPSFLRELCMSEYRFVFKHQIQAICEKLIFEVARSSNTLIRNRPAFLLSTISVFRWHGGRLPDGIGFLIELGGRDQGLYPLHQLLKIFINQLIET